MANRKEADEATHIHPRQKERTPELGPIFSGLEYVVRLEHTENRVELMKLLQRKTVWIDGYPSESVAKDINQFRNFYYWFKNWVHTSALMMENALLNARVTETEGDAEDHLRRLVLAFQNVIPTVNEITMSFNQELENDEQVRGVLTQAANTLEALVPNLDRQLKDVMAAVENNSTYKRYLDTWVEMGGITRQSLTELEQSDL
jgi:hypothetical protein